MAFETGTCGPAGIMGYGIFGQGPLGFALWLGFWALIIFSAYKLIGRIVQKRGEEAETHKLIEREERPKQAQEGNGTAGKGD